ncbi:hypothetical protein N9345_04060 [Candidatus Thioglobus sp.]|nr:hypothetical protein [Candidatus Thioglobus sp.]MDC0388752.1 hypothetical protein [Candidatus Thioglobus sp.]
MKVQQKIINHIAKLNLLLLLIGVGSVHAEETPVVTVSDGLTLTDLTGDAYNISGNQTGKLIFTF